MGFSNDSADSKESAYSAGDVGSISGSGRPREEEMTTLSNILAWVTPWTKEPSGLQSIGSQKNRTRLSDQACTSI